MSVNIWKVTNEKQGVRVLFRRTKKVTLFLGKTIALFLLKLHRLHESGGGRMRGSAHFSKYKTRFFERQKEEN